MSTQAWKRTARVSSVGLLGAALLLAVGACAGPDQKASAVTSQQFAANWQAHSTPLINRGVGLRPGTTAWMVPSTLPRGSYQVISRDGDNAHLIDGYRFEADGTPGKEMHLLLPFGSGRVEALDERYVVNPRSARVAP